MASKALSQNENYLVTIQRGSAGGLQIQANATAKLRLQVENRWVNILEALGLDTAIGQAASALLTGAQLVSGANFLPTWATSHVWRGSSGIEVSLEMRFDAWSDPQKDVVDPVKKLVQLFSPTRNNSTNATVNAALGALGSAVGTISSEVGNVISSTNGNVFLAPPGPTPYEYFTGAADAKLITVKIGKALRVNNLIPVNLGWEFENRFVKSGDPICALVTATFMSFTIPAQEDILKYFKDATTGGFGIT